MQLFLKKNEDRRVRAGHLWVFSNEINIAKSPLTACEPGQSATLHGADGRFLGSGYVNPASLIAFRLVNRRGEVGLDADLLRSRLARALALREHLFSVPYYRLCHGEGDYLPGLVVDRFGSLVSVQITTAGMERVKDDVVSVLVDLLQPETIVLRNDTGSRQLEGLPLYVETPLGALPERTEIIEGSIACTAPFAPEKGGQKTGWFYDQRRNREVTASLTPKGGSVLDAFCYVGGFGCAAAMAGASNVTFLDASAQALDAAQSNLERNAPHCEGECVKGDALTVLADLKEADRKFDVVCIDPPAFIKRRKDAAEGLAAYRRVNDLAMQLVTDGGMVVSSSCSHHMEADALHRLMTQSAVKRGFCSQLLHQGTQGPDHPIHPAMPETAYLKCFVFRLWKD